MNEQDQDKLLKVIDRSLDPTFKLSDKLTVQPNLPGSQAEWAKPVDTLTHQVTAVLKLPKNTSLSLAKKGDGVELKLTKKF